MKAHVIIDSKGRIDRRNDGDQRYAIYVSRAHAKRVIQWLGLTERTIREAGDDEIAGGVLCAAHCVPNWAASEETAKRFGHVTTPQAVWDFAEKIGLATLQYA